MATRFLTDRYATLIGNLPAASAYNDREMD